MALTLAMSELAGAVGAPALVVGPSIGTTAHALWGAVAREVGDAFRVIGWDLPGHGDTPLPEHPFTLADLAEAVFAGVDGLLGPGTPFVHAGDSVAGGVTQQLMLDAPARVRAGAAVCTAARFGEPRGWVDRAALVRAEGMGPLVESSRDRWFAPGFVDARPDVADPLVEGIRAVEPEGYALVCEALAAFDVRGRLAEIAGRLLVIGGASDVATPPSAQREIAASVPGAHLELLDGVAHLAPAEAPERVSDLLRNHFTKENA